jgi:NAD(P)-dependent dehydrogenase (short-subunit alcohol dehydrogenase family)
VMRINLDGAFFTAREAAKHMVGRHTGGDAAGGSIVFTTSGSAFFGQQSGQHYGASKAGVNSMMKAIAVQHARHGIRCNSVLPGWIETDMTAGAFGWTSSSPTCCRACRCAAGAPPTTSAASRSTSPAERRPTTPAT